MKEAILYKKLEDSQVQCQLCNNFCVIADEKFGACQVRQNQKGTLYTLNYGKIAAVGIDPIEKKPLYHFMPGTNTFSIALFGCNFHCSFCQNSELSQLNNQTLEINNDLKEFSPKEIVREAQKNNCPSISYTYTEPTIFAEFAIDVMKLAKKKNLKNIWVSNGYMSSDLLSEIRKTLDAINVDLKFFKEESYQQVCGGKLQPVLDNLIWIKKNNIHLEVTTLIIPGLNDSEEELEYIARFIYNHLGSDTPWHISAFHPAFRAGTIPSTSAEKLDLAQSIGRKVGLKFIYQGNI